MFSLICHAVSAPWVGFCEVWNNSNVYSLGRLCNARALPPAVPVNVTSDCQLPSLSNTLSFAGWENGEAHVRPKKEACVCFLVSLLDGQQWMCMLTLIRFHEIRGSHDVGLSDQAVAGA